MHWGEFNQTPAPMSRAFWKCLIPTVIWYVPLQPNSMFAEAGALMIWFPPIFETMRALKAKNWLRDAEDPLDARRGGATCRSDRRW
jgi:hypothetical protein